MKNVMGAAALSSILLLAVGCGEKKDPFLLLPFLSATTDGGNQGVPSTGTNNDPMPAVVPQTSNGAGSPAVTPSGPTIAEIVAAQPLTQDGTSTSPNVFVENGVIVGNLDGGSLVTGSGQTIQVISNGQLLGNLVVTVATEGGQVISGTITIVGDDFVFIPSTPFQSSEMYTVTITIGNGTPVAINIFLAVDNTCNAQSLFAQVPVLSSGNNTMNIKDKIVTDNNGAKKSLIGWDFAGGNFKFSLSNKTSGRKYVMTAYGVYNIAGHNCEVYFQRWSGSGEPVENFNITSYGTISVDATDSSIPNPSGGYYSFAKTYVQMKVLDSNGNDVTETDNAKMSLNWYASTAMKTAAPADQLKKLPYTAPERVHQSTMAAFMRGAGARSVLVLLGVLILAVGALGLIVLKRRRTA